MIANQAASLVKTGLSSYEDSLDQLAGLVAENLQDKKNMQEIEAEIRAVHTRNKTLVAAYYMDFQTGKLHISSYAKLNLDVRDTDTYRYLKANPKMQWLDVYKDKVTGAIMTSVVAPVFSDGKMVGTVGYDINLSTIGKIRAGISLAEKIEVADKWINKGYSVSVVLRIIGIPRSTYYYQKNYRVEEKKVSEGRPAPGYSIKEDGKKVSDEQIKEFLLEEIAGDAFNYGYRKLTKVLRRNYKLNFRS